jgi:hypothetical protein
MKAERPAGPRADCWPVLEVTRGERGDADRLRRLDSQEREAA